MSYPNHIAPKAKKKPSVWLIVVLVAFAATAACICGVAIATSGSEKKPGVPAAPPSTVQPSTAATSEAPPPQPTAVAKPAAGRGHAFARIHQPRRNRKALAVTDLAEAVACAEDVSFAADWLKELIDEHRAPQCTDEVWRFPVSEGEE